MSFLTLTEAHKAVAKSTAERSSLPTIVVQKRMQQVLFIRRTRQQFGHAFIRVYILLSVIFTSAKSALPMFLEQHFDHAFIVIALFLTLLYNTKQLFSSISYTAMLFLRIVFITMLLVSLDAFKVKVRTRTFSQTFQRLPTPWAKTSKSRFAALTAAETSPVVIWTTLRKLFSVFVGGPCQTETPQYFSYFNWLQHFLCYGTGGQSASRQLDCS